MTRALVDNPHVTEQIRKDTLNELADEKKKIAASAPAGKEPTAKEQEQVIDKVWASYCKRCRTKGRRLYCTMNADIYTFIKRITTLETI